MDLTGDAPYTAPSRKRRAKEISKDQSSSAFAASSGIGRKVSHAIDLTGDDDDQYAMPSQAEKPKWKRRAKDVDEDAAFEKAKPAAKKGKIKAGDNEGEKRLKKYALITDWECNPLLMCAKISCDYAWSSRQGHGESHHTEVCLFVNVLSPLLPRPFRVLISECHVELISSMLSHLLLSFSSPTEPKLTSSECSSLNEYVAAQ